MLFMISEGWIVTNSTLELLGLTFACLSIAGLSGLFSERAGIVNVAIEGMMGMGALVYSAFGHYNGQKLGNYSQILALILAGLTAASFALLHAYATINLKAQQIITGTALNMLSLGIALYFTESTASRVFSSNYYLIGFSSFPIINLFTILAVILLIITIIIFKKTKYGLRHKAAGENPHALDAAGINVTKVRYSGVLISGLFAGFAGAIVVHALANGSFSGTVEGKGFIALAILICSQWRVEFIAPVALVFATLESIFLKMPIFPNVSKWITSNQLLFQAMPFVLSIGVLVIFSNKSLAPKSLGIPFEKSMR